MIIDKTQTIIVNPGDIATALKEHVVIDINNGTGHPERGLPGEETHSRSRTALGVCSPFHGNR